MVVGEIVADVRRAPHADPVGNGPLRAGAFESVCVADNPVRHKSAVASARHKNSVLINCRILFEHEVGEVHQIFVVDVAVFSKNVHEVVSITVAAARVCEEHDVAFVCKELKLVVEDCAVNGFRSTVNFKDGRIFFRRVVVRRKKHKSGVVVIVFVPFDELRLCNINIFQSVV